MEARGVMAGQVSVSSTRYGDVSDSSVAKRY